MASNRNLSGENKGSVGLDASLFFTDTFRFTGQLIRAHGPEEGGNTVFFVRPSYDTSTTHLHFRYTHLGDRFADHVNVIGFIRADDRREMDSEFTKQFWFTEGAFERIAYDSNYNVYWNQEGVLRSWQLDQGLRADFRNRFTLGWGFQEEFKERDDALFEKDFRNREHSFLVGYNVREFQSIFATYRFGHNFDSDFRLFRAVVRRQITEGFNVEYELSRLWLRFAFSTDTIHFSSGRGAKSGGAPPVVSSPSVAPSSSRIRTIPSARPGITPSGVSATASFFVIRRLSTSTTATQSDPGPLRRRRFSRLRRN